MNPTAVAKQQRQQEVEALREEVTRLRERVCTLQDGGSLLHPPDDSGVHNASRSFSLPPSKEVQGKTCTGRTELCKDDVNSCGVAGREKPPLVNSSPMFHYV